MEEDGPNKEKEGETAAEPPPAAAPTRKERDDRDGFVITNKFLKDHCRKNHLYMTPRLNEVLYLHHKGFTRISNLEAYTGLRTLWLEHNCIETIENIGHLDDLRCLFLQDNKILEISNLENLTRLTTLNLASNFISRIQGLSTLVNLHTLVLSGNRMKTREDVEEVRECQSVAVLELNRNCLTEFGVVEVMSEMKNLRVLTLMGNPLVRNTKDYRRVVLSMCSGLTYLDQRPVSDRERKANDAWKRGGLEEERRCKEEWVRREQAKIYQGVLALMKMRDANLARRGIDPSSLEDQVAAVEERGKELMEQVKEDLRTGKQQRSRAGQGHDRDEATHIRDQCRSNLDCLSRSVELYRQNERLAVPDLGDRINRPQVLGKDEDDEGSVDDEVVSLSTTTSFEFLETSDARGREEDVKSLGSSFVADSEEMAEEEEEEEEDKSAADEGVLEGAVARDEKGEDEERKVVDFDRVFTLPEKPRIVAYGKGDKVALQPEEEEERTEEEATNSRLMYQLEALAGSSELTYRVEEEESGENEEEEGAVAGEPRKSSGDDDSVGKGGDVVTLEEIEFGGGRDDGLAALEEKEKVEEDVAAIPEVKREYLEVTGMRDDYAEEEDGDECPGRKKADLIGIGDEIRKLFGSSSSGTSVAVQRHPRRTPEKKRILIEELD